MNDPLHSVRDVEDDERFRAAVDLSPDAILMHMHGRITYVNDAAVRLLGASGRKVLLGRPVMERVAPEFREVALSRTDTIIDGRIAQPACMRWLRMDGTAFDVEVSASPFSTPEGISVQVFVRDVSERRRAERRIERVTHLYLALSHAAQRAAAANTREELFADVCTTAVEYGGLSTSWIGLTDAAGARVVPVAASGPGQRYSRRVRVSLDAHLPEGNDVLAAVIRERTTLVCNDIAADARARAGLEHAQAFGLRSLAACPLVEQGRVIGVIAYYADEVNYFQSELTDLLARIADQVSHALDRLASERRKQEAEGALRAQQRSMATLMDSLPGMVYRCRSDTHWTMDFVSVGCLDLTGYRADELTRGAPFSFLHLVHPDDRARVAAETLSALRARSRYTLEYRIVTREREEKWVWDNGVGVYDGDGNVDSLEGFVADITAVKRYREQLEYQAHHDPLTGLANRGLLRERLHHAIAQAERQQRALALMFIDLDDFKLINDSMGHSVGDELLKLAAHRLQVCVREEDTVARLGGDEFVLLLVDQDGERSVSHAVERLREATSQPYRVLGKEFVLTCSVGVALFPGDGRDVETLLKHADAAMYRAKALGRNAHQFFTEEINTQIGERLAVERDLRRALVNGEFALHYQPKVALRSGRMIGAEALLRWHHPEKGMIPPAHFIPIAEETGLIVALGDWVLREAACQAKAWRDAGLEFDCLSVNLSARQFRQRDLVQQVDAALRASALPPHCLDLELTESVMMENVEANLHCLQALKALGIQLSLDDFGTGYSSLSYLRRFPVDRLKIDKSFVRDIVRDAGDAAITQAVIRLGQILGLAVTAEGVESEEQLKFLARHGCDEAQGYFFSPPLTASAFEALWRHGLLAPSGWSVPLNLPAVV